MKFTGLTKNELKILAAVSMTIDHAGITLFPGIAVLRIIGRLAFPIFAFSIYEGCRYTHNRAKYLLQVFLLGVACALGYFIFCREVFGNILITFTLSICIIFAFQEFYKALTASEKNLKYRISSILLLVAAVSGSYVVCRLVGVDYGFPGVMVPVACEIFSVQKPLIRVLIKRNHAALLGLTVGLVFLAIYRGGDQWWSLFSLVPLLLSNAAKGKHNMKYFFYVFYPTHLVLLEGISLLMK